MARPAKQKTEIDTKESPSERFIRLGEARVGKALISIEAIAKLVGVHYAATPSQLDNIEKHLSNAVSNTMTVLRGGKKSKRLVSLSD